LLVKPLTSAIFIIPSQRAIIPVNPIESLKAFIAASGTELTRFLRLPVIKAVTVEATSKKSQMMFSNRDSSDQHAVVTSRTEEI
jgi:hypothetical protein